MKPDSPVPAPPSNDAAEALCSCSDDLKAFLDDELSSWQRARVRFHLRACAACREELHLMQTLTEELQKTEATNAEAPLAPELRAQILDAARQSAPTPRAPTPAPLFNPPPAEVPSARRSFRLAPVLGLIPLVLCVVLVGMTLTGGKVRNTFNRAADSINTETDGYMPGDSASQDDRAAGAAPPAAPSTSSANEVFRRGAPSAGSAGSSALGSRALPSEPAVRRVHKQGSLTVSVADVEAGNDKVTSIVKNAGGFVVTSSLSSASGGGRSAQLELRVPVDKFEETVRTVSGLGRVSAKNISGEDVTDQYVTTRAGRDVMVRELAIREVQYRALRAKAKRGDQEQLWQLQNQLLQLRSQVAQTRARFDALHKLAALSALSVTLQEKATAPAAHTLSQDLSQTGREAWASFLTTARLPLSLLIYCLAYSPIWLPAWLLWRRYAPPARR